MYRELREICELNGVSGREDAVREYIMGKLPKDVTTKVDALGNLYVHKKGRRTPNKRVMVAAHMDEVGLIITYITEDGYLKSGNLGGIDPAVLAGRVVELESGVRGVIGVKPIHLLDKAEREKKLDRDSFVIDIGAKSREDAEKYVALGDFAAFLPEWKEFGKDSLKMKALDDRMGCIMMLNLIRDDLEYDTDFVFTVQEEVGTRGAGVAANVVDPDIAIILETTTAGDIAGTTGEKRTCELGRGPVISFMDGGTVYDNKLYESTMNLAKRLDLPHQTKTRIAGGNDSSAIQRSGSGVRVLAISVPTRYLHSASCVVRKSDVDATLNLVGEVLKNLETEII